MNRVLLFLSLAMFSAPGVFADTEPVESEPQPTRWQMIHEVEQRKDELFAEYQGEKERLKEEYHAAVELLEREQPEDFMRQKVRLEKQYKEDKSQLLDDFRRYNVALKRRESALKGRQYVPYRELGTLYRLRRGSEKESIIGTRPDDSVKRRNYIPAAPDTQRSYTDKTKMGIGSIRYRGRSH
ncbi:MAG: hypothetical protein KC900_06145 [Candidatus Omnitrophica bacterium]|nr:hypothetical protein [Candidatus Omnitrophota bacterium]